MSSQVVTNILRFFGLVLLQGLILKRVEFTGTFFEHVHIIIYPIFILLLPLRTPSSIVVFWSFLAGLSVDLFYYSPGVHASAACLIGFIRQLVLSILEPRGGYNVLYSPTMHRMGQAWFLRYSAILVAVCLFTYFSVEAFTFVYIGKILLNTIVSFVFSMLLLLVYQAVLNPEE